MNLPAMAPSYGVAAHYITHRALTQCWRLRCFNGVKPNCDLGLCPSCVEDLRVATNS